MQPFADAARRADKTRRAGQFEQPPASPNVAGARLKPLKSGPRSLLKVHVRNDAGVDVVPQRFRISAVDSPNPYRPAL